MIVTHKNYAFSVLLQIVLVLNHMKTFLMTTCSISNMKELFDDNLVTCSGPFSFMIFAYFFEIPYDTFAFNLKSLKSK